MVWLCYAYNISLDITKTYLEQFLIINLGYCAFLLSNIFNTNETQCGGNDNFEPVSQQGGGEQVWASYVLTDCLHSNCKKQYFRRIHTYLLTYLLKKHQHTHLCLQTSTFLW